MIVVKLGAQKRHIAFHNMTKPFGYCTFIIIAIQVVFAIVRHDNMWMRITTFDSVDGAEVRRCSANDRTFMCFSEFCKKQIACGICKCLNAVLSFHSPRLRFLKFSITLLCYCFEVIYHYREFVLLRVHFRFDHMIDWFTGKLMGWIQTGFHFNCL